MHVGMSKRYDHDTVHNCQGAKVNGSRIISIIDIVNVFFRWLSEA